MQHDVRLAAGGVGTTSLTEILGAFSYALDLTEGQPAGHAMRCAYMALRLGRALGLDEATRRDLHFAVLLKDLGCSSNAARIAELYACDDRAFKMDWKTVPEGLPATLRFVLATTGKGRGLLTRAAKVSNIFRNGDAIAQEMIQTRCTRGADIARRLRFSDAVCEGIYRLDEHYDGSGRPGRLAGDAIPLFARIALLAQVADVFLQAGGAQAARDEVAHRAASWLDPELARIFARVADDDFFDDLAAPGLDLLVAAMVPVAEAVPVDEDYLDDIAAAFGEVVDAKSPYTSGHSSRVATYSAAMATAVGLSPLRTRRLRRAAYLHDVGKLGVSSAILEKPGKLGDGEWAEMRGHADHTRAILSRIECMADMADIAASHHERLDGAGYPLGLAEADIARETRLITLCDFYDALTADRPYRAAMTHEQAMAIIEGEVGKAVDGEAFEALRTAVGR